MANTSNLNFDSAAPVDDAYVSALPIEIRMCRASLKYRGDKEHVAMGALGVGGEHKPGSAVVYVQATAPAYKPDAVTALDSGDMGRVWYDTTTATLRVYIYGTGWQAVSDPALVMLLAGTQTVTGNKTFSGSLTVTGVSAFTNTMSVTGMATLTGGFTLGANANCAGKQLTSLVLENRTSEPSAPVNGQIWFRTDL
jgi:hypothetical protein